MIDPYYRISIRTKTERLHLPLQWKYNEIKADEEGHSMTGKKVKASHYMGKLNRIYHLRQDI